jgi:hypothetical protein
MRLWEATVLNHKSLFGIAFFLGAVWISSGCFAAETQGSSVRIVRTGPSWKLLYNGQPYYIKGAGGQMQLDMLVAAGGNSIRTWGTNDARRILDEAYAKGLTVCMGLWVQHERHGFDYNDKKAVKQQLENFRSAVRNYKDHPALLLWGIGNEVHINARNKRVWDAINEISKMIHLEDGNHPTMTVTAGITPDLVETIQKRAPDLDILGVNAYASLGGIPDGLRKMGWAKPYIITEWGINGMWEVNKTAWGAPLEPPSGLKGPIYYDRYMNVIAANSNRGMLGSYVFQWGWKQEKTATWFGIFAPPGVKTTIYDYVRKAWTGSFPDGLCPSVRSITMNGFSAQENVTVKKGSENSVIIKGESNSTKPLQYKWQLFQESDSTKTGGDYEDAPPELQGLFLGEPKNELRFRAPERRGAYRIYVYVYNEHGAGTANFPFFVE